jgi:hypothetical protein
MLAIIVASLCVIGYGMAGSAAVATVFHAFKQHSQRDAFLSFGQRTLLVQAKSTEPKISVHSVPGEAYIPCYLETEIPVRMR